MLWNFLKPVLLFIPLAAIQLVIVPIISVADIVPNVLIVLVILYTLKHGQIYGTVLGFVIGGLFDLISGGLLGGYMLAFTVTSFIGGYFFNENKIDANTTTFAFVFTVFLCGTISSFLYAAVTTTSTDINIFYLTVEEGILPGIYTAVLAIPVVIFSPKKDLI